MPETAEIESNNEKPAEATIDYSEIDPMFGPPPVMNYTAVAPQPQKSEKGGFFKKYFDKKINKEC